MTRDEYFTAMLLVLGPPVFCGTVSEHNNYAFKARRFIARNWPPMISKLRGISDIERKYRMWYGRELRGRR